MIIPFTEPAESTDQVQDVARKCWVQFLALDRFIYRLGEPAAGGLAPWSFYEVQADRYKEIVEDSYPYYRAATVLQQVLAYPLLFPRSLLKLWGEFREVKSQRFPPDRPSLRWRSYVQRELERITDSPVPFEILEIIVAAISTLGVLPHDGLDEEVLMYQLAMKKWSREAAEDDALRGAGFDLVLGELKPILDGLGILLGREIDREVSIFSAGSEAALLRTWKALVLSRSNVGEGIEWIALQLERMMTTYRATTSHLGYALLREPSLKYVEDFQLGSEERPGAVPPARPDGYPGRTEELFEIAREGSVARLLTVARRLDRWRKDRPEVEAVTGDFHFTAWWALLQESRLGQLFKVVPKATPLVPDPQNLHQVIDADPLFPPGVFPGYLSQRARAAAEQVSLQAESHRHTELLKADAKRLGVRGMLTGDLASRRGIAL